MSDALKYSEVKIENQLTALEKNGRSKGQKNIGNCETGDY